MVSGRSYARSLSDRVRLDLREWISVNGHQGDVIILGSPREMFECLLEDIIAGCLGRRGSSALDVGDQTPQAIRVALGVIFISNPIGIEQETGSRR